MGLGAAAVASEGHHRFGPPKVTSTPLPIPISEPVNQSKCNQYQWQTYDCPIERLLLIHLKSSDVLQFLSLASDRTSNEEGVRGN